MNPKILKRITAVITSIVLVVTCYGSTFKEICAFAEEISTESINADELIKCGDLNSDGQINVFDVMRAKRDILNKNPQPTRIADINDDGAFNIQDAMILQDYVLLRDVSKYKKLGQNSESEELSNDYKYSVFSGSDSGTEGITLTGEEIIVNSNIASNGNIEISGECLIQPHRSVSENANVLPLYMDSKIMSTYFSDSETYDEFTVEQGDDINYIIEKPLISYGDISIHKELTLDKTCMMAYNSITIENNTINNGDTVLYSKYGDISIDGDLINLVGLIYAPSGTVKLSAKNITINGIIIAKHVIMEASEKINIDSNPELAKFIGVDSENLFIPYSEWEYIKKDDAEVFPEIVKEQIYNNPLSVDDEWLRINYGDEVVDAYNETMKKQLVETLYIGQSEGVSNYRDVIAVLEDSLKNNYSDLIWLKTKLPDKIIPGGQLSVGIGNCEISSEVVENDDFIGPRLPYYGPYKWDFYVDSENNPEISNKIPENTKKKFIINDLPSFTTLLAGGATLFEGAKDAVVTGLTGIAASITQSICSTFEKTGTEKAVEKAKSEISKRLAKIADTDLFKKAEAVTAEGFKIDFGPLDFNISVVNDKWNVETKVDNTSVTLEKIKNIFDDDTLSYINEKSNKVYGEIYEKIENVTDISSEVIQNTVEIVECFENDTDKFLVAYNKLNNIKEAYNSLTYFNNRLSAYSSDKTKYCFDIKNKYDTEDPYLIIKNELHNSGVSYPEYKFSTHHVVPIKDSNAALAQNILEAYKIDINSAANGVFLPVEDSLYSVYESTHRGSHTKYYCTTINNRLNDIVINNLGNDFEAIQKALCDELTNIKLDLVNGKISVNMREEK